MYQTRRNEKHLRRYREGCSSSSITMTVVDVSHGVIGDIRSIEKANETIKKNTNNNNQLRQ
jgi:hypothetical protein